MKIRSHQAPTVAVLAASLALFSSGALAATPKAGSSCTKLNQTIASGSQTLVCLKSGTKLVWTVKATVSKSAAPSKALIPMALPVPQNGEITFQNAASNANRIPQVAWQRVQDAIAANPEVKIPTTIDIGPNTKADLSTIQNALNRIYKLFSGFRSVSSFTGIVYVAKDLAWAQSDGLKLYKKEGVKGAGELDSVKDMSSASCEFRDNIAVDCGGGMALTFKHNGSSAGGSFYGVQNSMVQNSQTIDFWTPAGITNFAGPMTQVTHEATHNYQFIQFYNLPFKSGQNTAADQMHDFAPWWFSEGHANGIGISVFTENLNSYLNVRGQTVIRNPGPRAQLPTFTPAGIKTFLMSAQKADPSNGNYALGYSIGYAAVEALVAIGGPQSTMALYALGGSGENWETAFKHVYGITWDQGAAALGQILAAEYQATPFTN